MNTSGLVRHGLLQAVALVLGVTFLGFLLMVYFAPDLSYQLAGKNPTAEQIQQIRQQLGYDQPLPVRYLQYLQELATFDFGYSDSSGERVTALLARTLPVSAALLLPGFILGHILAMGLGAVAAYGRGRWTDRLIAVVSGTGMSISFIVVMIAFQLVFASSYGLNWFPARGWQWATPAQYLSHVAVPTLTILFVSSGYNTRFYRAVFVEQIGQDYVKAARAFGYSRTRTFFRVILPNSLLPVLTRVLYSVPAILVGGSLLLESYFGIPGVGKSTFDAITSGDQPVLKAVIALSSLALAVVMLSVDRLYRVVDPRLRG
ncbi:MAG: ABC transporter permease [Xanthomonadales bacterium]|nr:ABC transporter permease [Xanthomonadales bacterium]